MENSELKTIDEVDDEFWQISKGDVHLNLGEYQKEFIEYIKNNYKLIKTNGK